MMNLTRTESVKIYFPKLGIMTVLAYSYFKPFFFFTNQWLVEMKLVGENYNCYTRSRGNIATE